MKPNLLIDFEETWKSSNADDGQELIQLFEFLIPSPSSQQKCCSPTPASEIVRMRSEFAARGGRRGGTTGGAYLISTVALLMVLILLYFVISFPLMTTNSEVERKNENLTNETTATTVTTTATLVPDKTTTTEEPEDIYKHLGDTMHRRQIPLIHMPFLYRLRFKLFLPWKKDVSFGTDDFAVEGNVQMHFVSGGGSRIVLHSDASEQHIGDCVVTDEFGRQIFIKHVGRGFSQVLDLHLSADMINGMNYTLDVAFRGHIATHKQKGLFAAPYDKNGETRQIVATQLQLSEARTVFPCIDIPEVKAQFDTIIEHPVGTEAVSNMMENSTVSEGSWTVTTFHRTPPMSTYLFAFIVSDFPYLESFSAKGVRTRVYCDPAKIKNAEIMSNSTGPLLGFFEEYFGIPYPLDKLDVVILPALEVTAMENWGLITVRQTEGLFMPKLFPIVQKHNVQEVISHEVAHQWFGNFVTMKWWNNLWLNEGFATMIGHRAVDFLENTTFRYQEMTAEFMCFVLRQDQMENSISVSTSGDDGIQRVLEMHPNQKVIIYRKAAIITRMIERLVEEDIFRQGLHRFLNTFMYKNADHDDLFNVLTYVHDSSSGGHLTGQNFSLSDVMDTWLRQSSFPVVHVNRKEGSIVTLRQERYKHQPRAPKNARDSFIWKIPIFYDDPVSGKHKVFWLTDRYPTLFDMGGQLLVDPNQLTYMRLRYDMTMYSDITNQLLENHQAIPTNSRSRLIDDTLAMAENGQMSYQVPFNMTMYLPRETAFRPFQTFSAYLDFFIPRLFSQEGYPKYREYLLMLLASQFDKMQKEGFDIDYEDNVDYYKLRELVVYRACSIGYQNCVEMSRQKFEELKKNCSSSSQLLSDISCNTIPFYLRQHIYASVIAHGTQDDFDFLFKKWKSEHFMLERDRIWYGMCGTLSQENSDKIWINLFRNRARENIRERAIACSKFMKNESLLLDMMLQKSEEIKKLLHKSGPSFQMLLTLITRQVNNSSHLEKVKKLFEVYPTEFAPYTFEQLRRSAEGRFQWRETVGIYLVGNATETVKKMRKKRVGGYKTEKY